MATGRFYYYPEPTGTLNTIDFDTGTGPWATDLQIVQNARMAARARGDGRLFRAFLGATVDLDLTVSACVDAEQRRKFEGFLNHIKRGGYFGFALDKDKAWGSPLVLPTLQRAVASVCGGQRWYEPTVSLVAGDPLIFEMPGPDFRIDHVDLGSTISASTTTFSHDAVQYEFLWSSGSGAHVRHRDFWPMVCLRGDAYSAPIIEWTRRVYFDMRLALSYDLASVVEVAQSGGVLQVGASAGNGSSTNLILGELDRASVEGAYNLGD